MLLFVKQSRESNAVFCHNAHPFHPRAIPGRLVSASLGFFQMPQDFQTIVDDLMKIAKIYN